MIQRRSFIAGMLATMVAPSVVRAAHPMDGAPEPLLPRPEAQYIKNLQQSMERTAQIFTSGAFVVGDKFTIAGRHEESSKALQIFVVTGVVGANTFAIDRCGAKIKEQTRVAAQPAYMALRKSRW